MKHRTVTHRAHHDRQLWRLALAKVAGRASIGLRRFADRIDPWHEDDEWFTASPRFRVEMAYRLDPPRATE